MWRILQEGKIMNVLPIKSSQTQNRNQNTSFKAFIANPTELKTINEAVNSLPKNIRENFKLYSMTDFIELAFPKDPKAVDNFQYFQSPVKNTFLTKMEAKLISSGPVETLSERILETIKKARKIDLLSTTRKALDVKRENGSLQSILNLKEQLLGKDVPVYTMEEICLRGIDTYINKHISRGKKEKKVVIPCLGDFMSNVQISVLKSLKKFGGYSMTREMADEAMKNHSNNMYEYLYRLVNKSPITLLTTNQ